MKTQIAFLLIVSFHLNAQFYIPLKYKMPKCGGKKNPDTTSYFLLADKKWIIQYPSGKMDTIFSDINGKIKVPNKKGVYLIYDAQKYYKQTPADFPPQFYDKTCLEKFYSTPDFTIKVSSNKKYKIEPQFIQKYCIDKHPCLRKDTVIPKIPKQ